ncbi:MAG: NAD(P)-dependent oxidoreductase [Betaproteobacteria bacterium]|nr:NAD(P)-dependent oxidoreductase [Betaproteobacteria bacterium]
MASKQRSGEPAVGVIGLGIMGGAMARNLVKAGFRVIGHDVQPRIRAALSRAGCTRAGSNAEVARGAPIVITSLPSAAALGEVCEELATSGVRKLIVVETSTLPLEAKESAQRRLALSGITLLDCPLSGTGAQARTRDLSVLASGPRAAVKKCISVFDGFARSHHYLGAFGAGSKMKFAANLLVAIHNVAAAEALTLARKSGLDAATALRVLSDGAGDSRMLRVRGPAMVAEDYTDATMRVEIWQKDMDIIARYAAGIGVPAPLFLASAPIYTAAIAAGYGTQDTAAVCAVLSNMAGLGRKRG